MKKKTTFKQARKIIETDNSTEYVYTPEAPRTFDKLRTKIMQFAGSLVGKIILFVIITIGLYLLIAL